jgi:hypothetical protein
LEAVLEGGLQLSQYYTSIIFSALSSIFATEQVKPPDLPKIRVEIL